jgi:hypothetical protein
MQGRSVDIIVVAEGVKRMHQCLATWSETVEVHETFGGQPVWDGAVEVFDLKGHPQAARCYAWGEPPEAEGGKPKVYAVLEVPPVRSAADAVRASIVARHRGQA